MGIKKIVVTGSGGTIGTRISIIGSGWVGTLIGKGFAELGNEIIFYDIVDKALPNFTKDINHAIENSDISFICVPTPTNEDGEIDLSYIKDAVKNIGAILAEKDNYHVIEAVQQLPSNR